jgi:hypothetical protein
LEAKRKKKKKKSNIDKKNPFFYAAKNKKQKNKERKEKEKDMLRRFWRAHSAMVSTRRQCTYVSSQFSYFSTSSAALRSTSTAETVDFALEVDTNTNKLVEHGDDGESVVIEQQQREQEEQENNVRKEEEEEEEEEELDEATRLRRADNDFRQSMKQAGEAFAKQFSMTLHPTVEFILQNESLTRHGKDALQQYLNTPALFRGVIDAQIYNALLLRVLRSRLPGWKRLFQRLWKDMENSEVEPTVETWGILLGLLAEYGDVQGIEALIEEHIRPANAFNSYTETALLNAYRVANDASKFDALWATVSAREPVNKAHRQVAIRCFSERGDLDEAQRLVGIDEQPHPLSFVVLMESIWRQTGDARRVDALFMRYTLAGYSPTRKVHSIMRHVWKRLDHPVLVDQLDKP